MSSEGAAVAVLTLDDWRTKVEACAEQVKTLKTTDGVEKEAVGAAVTALLDAKRSFAKLNKGIGIDGKPFEEPMSKADKKKQKKQGTPAGPAKEVRTPILYFCMNIAYKHIPYMTRPFHHSSTFLDVDAHSLPFDCYKCIDGGS
jgi:hypothetical protein